MYMLGSVTGVFLVLEKRWGIMDRRAVAGVKFWHVLASTFIFDSLVIIAQLGIMFTMLPYFYGMTCQGSWLLAVALVYFVSISALTCSKKKEKN
jgi:uncharacterized membrane protein